MPRKSSSQPRSACPISIALESLGDSWTLLIVRDLMFKGLRTFNEFQNAGEGIASNILADRLSRLELAGLLTKRRDGEDARRIVYRLTVKGIDLAPVLIELVLWSAKHEDTAAPATTLREMRQHRQRFLDQVRADWRSSAD
jgi:DNA-binding HxlR family transcriptional regulator